VIVADAKLVVRLLLPGEHNAVARSWRARHPVWLLPRLWRSEVRNALIGYVRIGQLELATAQRLMALAERALARGERQVESRRVLDLAAASGRSAYDCEYVALAEAEGVELVTDDGPVLKAFPGLTVPMVSHD